jgi:Schlafen group 3, DNA/RNA helicase domain
MRREYYSASIADFLTATANEILGQLTRSKPFSLEQTQRNAWLEEMRILRQVLTSREGRIYFEYARNRIRKPERQVYLNAYRVLLTRARQGMVIVVPQGDSDDPTRKPEFYDPTFEYLRDVGFSTI